MRSCIFLDIDENLGGENCQNFFRYRDDFRLCMIEAYDLGMMVTPYPTLCEVKHHVSDQGYGWVTDGGSGSFFLTTI